LCDGWEEAGGGIGPEPQTTRKGAEGSIMLMMEGGEGRPSVAGSRGLGRKHGPGEWKWAREDKGKICSDRKGEREAKQAAGPLPRALAMFRRSL
jgi:hypothetical protein